jgi:hypothetical protein
MPNVREMRVVKIGEAETRRGGVVGKSRQAKKQSDQVRNPKCK